MNKPMPAIPTAPTKAPFKEKTLFLSLFKPLPTDLKTFLVLSLARI